MAGTAARRVAADGRTPEQQGTRMGRCHPLSRRTREASAEGSRCVTGVTLDAGGLMAVDRNDRRMLVLLERATERGARITVPATALAQAVRSPARQARLSRLIRQ